MIDASRGFKKDGKEARFLDDEQVAEMFAHLANKPVMLQAIVTVLVYTGLRKGELSGLKWSDLDVKNKVNAYTARPSLYARQGHI